MREDQLRIPDARTRFAEALLPERRAAALARWDAHAPRLLEALASLYAHTTRFDDTLSRFVEGLADGINERPQALRASDDARERDPSWFLAQDTIGYSAYVDRFGGDLPGVAEHVPYLQRLGVRYLHLLPFLQAREGDNDGGFAVRDYDAVDPALGTNDDLLALTARLRDAGIGLCADLVLNHTADDHAWALAARSGDARYRDYYHIFPDRTLPDAYERTLGQVFPQTAPGNFTHVPNVGWVWTTFYGYQWDLNWSNPDVFAHMALTLLRLANRGIEAFRLDSTAYLWKFAGTDCMNRPEAHTILRALRAVCDIAAPGVLLKAEAIVPARELTPYFGLRNGNAADATDAVGDECHLAYHSTLMAALWVALAEARGDVLADIVARTPALPPACGWLTYLRCHDDIGWGVLREEAAGDSEHAPFDLARIARFYAGETPGSYARGRAFQSAGCEHVHGTNGTAAALTGIEAALARGDSDALSLAERRFTLLYGIVFAAAGLPTLYMGDEIALGNDETYLDDAERADEGRWLHRPAMDWARAHAAEALDALRNDDEMNRVDDDANATALRIGRALRAMIAVRRATPDLRADASMRAVPLGDAAAFGLRRGDGFMALCNLSAREIAIVPPPELADARWRDALDGGRDTALPTRLPPYALRWFVRA
ncbi:MAG: amylosucrase [Xanthomonadaceae bacterium]|nr:amylosucrase [Xanthomonadaceae bacterium]